MTDYNRTNSAENGSRRHNESIEELYEEVCKVPLLLNDDNQEFIQIMESSIAAKVTNAANSFSSANSNGLVSNILASLTAQEENYLKVIDQVFFGSPNKNVPEDVHRPDDNVVDGGAMFRNNESMGGASSNQVQDTYHGTSSTLPTPNVGSSSMHANRVIEHYVATRFYAAVELFYDYAFQHFPAPMKKEDQ